MFRVTFHGFGKFAYVFIWQLDSTWLEIRDGGAYIIIVIYVLLFYLTVDMNLEHFMNFVRNFML